MNPVAGPTYRTRDRELLFRAVRRRMLVERLMRLGFLRSPRLEAAFRAVDRANYLSPHLRPRAADDDTLVTRRREGDGLAVSSSTAPWMMAGMLELLDVRAGDRVLEIGTGTGYNAAILSRSVGPEGQVCTIESDAGLREEALEALARDAIGNVDARVGDARDGWPAGGPFDRIIATADAWPFPKAWHEQLKPGGVAVAPVAGFIHRLVREGDVLQGGVWRSSGFIPLCGGAGERVRSYGGYYDDVSDEDYRREKGRGFVLQTIEACPDAGFVDWFDGFEPDGQSYPFPSTRGPGAGLPNRNDVVDGFRLCLSAVERHDFARVAMADARRGFRGWGIGLVRAEARGAAFLVNLECAEEEAGPERMGGVFRCGDPAAAAALRGAYVGWRDLGGPPCSRYCVTIDVGAGASGGARYALSFDAGKGRGPT